MAIYGIHASHEQIPPSRLLETVVQAEAAGFQAGMCSDHFAPWSARQGESGFAWSWLGAALASTSLRYGVVNAPGQRYHPAIIAQAAATLAEMFPGRLWLALGSGQALNEHVTGQPWPDKATRDARLLECVQVLRALFAGEEVTHDGLVRVHRARLWSRPAEPPPLIGAAVSVETARRAGSWADGLVTINQPHEHLRKMIDAFRAGGGEGKPLYLQVHLSWAPTEAEALAVAHDQWRSNVFGSRLAWELEDPDQFDAAAAFVAPDDVRRHVLVSADPREHVDRLAGYAELGFEQILLHHVGQQQRAFVDTFAEHVLPELSRGVAA